MLTAGIGLCYYSLIFPRSFGVLLWEIFTMGERPHSLLNDDVVLEGIVHKKILPTQTDIKVPFVDEM